MYQLGKPANSHLWEEEPELPARFVQRFKLEEETRHADRSSKKGITRISQNHFGKTLDNAKENNQNRDSNCCCCHESNKYQSDKNDYHTVQLQNRISELEGDLIVVEKEKIELEEYYKLVTAEVTAQSCAAKEELSVLKTRMNSQANQFRSQKLEASYDDLNKVETELKNKQSFLNDAKIRLERSLREQSTLLDQNDELKQRIMQCQAEASQNERLFQTFKRDTQDSLHSLRQMNKDYLDMIDSLRSNVEELNSEISRLLRESTELAIVRESHQESLRLFAQLQNKYEFDLRAIQDACDARESQLQLCKERNAQTESQLYYHQQDLADKNGRIEAQIQEIGLLQGRISLLNDQKQHLEHKNQLFERQIYAFQEQIATTGCQHREMEERHRSTAKQIIAEYEQLIFQLKSKINQDIENQKKAVEEQEAKLFKVGREKAFEESFLLEKINTCQLKLRQNDLQIETLKQSKNDLSRLLAQSQAEINNLTLKLEHTKFKRLQADQQISIREFESMRERQCILRQTIASLESALAKAQNGVQMLEAELHGKLKTAQETQKLKDLILRMEAAHENERKEIKRDYDIVYGKYEKYKLIAKGQHLQLQHQK